MRTWILLSLVLGCSAAITPGSGEEGGDQALESEVQQAGPVGRETYRALRGVASRVTLASLGEDGGDTCTASFRKGPASELSSREVLRLFGYKVETQLSGETFFFANVAKNDSSFWETFVEREQDEDAAKEVKRILTGPDVLGLATMRIHDNRPFSAPAFLVAHMRDQSLVALRGRVGGMSL